MKAQAKLVVLALAGVLLLTAGGFAWACTAASSVAIERNSGPVGVPVNITGATFGPGPVEVRWNSTDGPLLATAQGPRFSVPITPPAGTQPDVYYIVAIQRGPEGVFKASETFEVTGSTGGEVQTDAQTQTLEGTGRTSASTKAGSDLWRGFGSGTSLQTGLSSTTAPVAERGISLMWGLGLFATGLSGLLVAATLPAIRSRRKRAYLTTTNGSSGIS